MRSPFQAKNNVVPNMEIRTQSIVIHTKHPAQYFKRTIQRIPTNKENYKARSKTKYKTIASYAWTATKRNVE